MSDQDDTLLDEDLGDEEYDLGNDEEEALLADDYEIDRQNSYKGEEETDDVLDLGVTDALDDLDAEDDNNDNAYINVPNNCYANDQHHDNHVNYYNQNDNINYNDENTHHHHHHQYENNISSHGGGGDYGGHNNMHHVTSDLREKLKKTIPRDIIVGNGQGMEDDDCDEARERRNRFQNERTVISPKMNNEIPDSLENVVTVDQPRMSFRGRGGRGRGIRGGGRGARFPGPNMGNFNPRYPVRMQFEDQNLKFRAPLIETRPQIFPNAPSNQMNPQLIYHQDNPHIIPPQFQQFNPQGVSPHPRPHFNEPRPQFNPNQFHPQSPQAPLPPQPRHQNPQMEFIPRGPMQQAPPRYNGPQNPQFIQNQQQRFQRPPHENELSVRPMGNRLPMMVHQGPLNNMPRQQMPGQRGPPPPPPQQMHQGPPRHPGMPVPRQDGQMPVFRQPIPNQMPQIQHNGPPGQQVFENRQQFQQENRNIYEQRQFDNRPLPVIQFNNQGQQVVHHQTGPSVVPAVPNVPLASGHKILINPHFRGNVQPPQEARPTWEGSQPPSHQQQLPNEQFASQSAQYQGQQQASYSQQLAPQSGAQASNDYSKKYPQNNKNDDPYAYFSDVWQENKTSKPSRSSTPPKSYSGDNNYSRDSNYRDYEKYKSDGRDNYQASKDQRGRDRSPQSRPRDHHQSQRSRPPSTNNHDSYDQRSRLQNSSNRPPLKPPQKRTPEPHDRSNRGSSPKRSKNHRNFHEARSTTTHNSNNIKKEEDMDPEMRDYRKKMEEQKRLREKILQEKENRRKQAALDKQIDESKNTKNTDIQQENKSLGSSLKKDDVDSQNQSTNRSRVRAGSEDKDETGGRVVKRTDKNITDDTAAKKSSYTDAMVRQIPPGTRRVIIQKTRVATSLQKPSLNNHSNDDSDMTNEKVTEITKIVKKLPLGVQKKKTIKKIANEQSDGGRKILLNDSTSGNATTAHSNRVVLQKPIQIKRTIDNKTNIVIVENISSNTNETKLREMCKGIGTVESVIIGDDNESATIVFKTHSAAMVFHKKYQKKMIDQSVINIRLVSQAGTLSQRN
ncbi:putative uncharacterized protein DDB_G0282133 isoform X2 [Aphidius gifuensis]|uniref:putative uncharacterized protein DDB_G0282133 isoform X2 n=1 Tax=Aphidius gifuensis TaxID=684658 RepID=UPI001CDB6E0E|nr:putative uncharacterized protein DDB_G0282133 isoform X2 [Aphidius gifuensis]